MDWGGTVSLRLILPEFSFWGLLSGSPLNPFSPPHPPPQQVHPDGDPTDPSRHSRFPLGGQLGGNGGGCGVLGGTGRDWGAMGGIGGYWEELGGTGGTRGTLGGTGGALGGADWDWGGTEGLLGGTGRNLGGNGAHWGAVGPPSHSPSPPFPPPVLCISGCIGATTPPRLSAVLGVTAAPWSCAGTTYGCYGGGYGAAIGQGSKELLWGRGVAVGTLVGLGGG